MVRLEEAENPVEYHDKNSESLLKKYDIPLHYLDFTYVQQCKDGRELEKIYHILKSGQEGYYPDLLRATEDRMAQIKPNSKYLRKLTPVLSKDELDKGELKKITEDFDEWLQIVNRSNQELVEAPRRFPQDIPEVRKTSESADKKEKPQAKRIASTDYKSWDKFDAETEMLKMDLEEEKMRKRATPGERKKPSVKFGEFTTRAEALFEANREKEKGNECFKAGEYEDALEHYNNSITYCPSAILFTNRAVTHLRMKNYEKAIADCQSALKYDPKNLKANLRMAQAFQALNKPVDALVYAEDAIRIDPNNSFAQQIAQKARETSGQNPNTRNIRFKIVETKSETPKSILKKAPVEKRKRTEPELIPIPGSSRMQPPYFEVASQNTKQKQVVALENLKALFLAPLDTDDEGECLEQHIPVKSKLDFQEDKNQICLRIDKGKNYVVVDNRHAPSVKRKESDGGFTSKNKCKGGKNYKAKGRSRNSDGLTKQVEETKTRAVMNLEQETINPNRENTNTPRNSQMRVENNTTEDIRGGGEPHLEHQSTPEIPREIHLPYTFVKTWQSVKKDGNYSGFVPIIRSLNMQRITEVIGNKIDATILSDIINCLYRHFAVADEVQKVYETLLNLCRLQRFSIAVMFLSESDKRIVQNLMEFLRQHGRALPEDFSAHFAINKN